MMKIDNYINIAILYAMLIALIIFFIFCLIQSIVMIYKNIKYMTKRKKYITIIDDEGREYFVKKSDILQVEKYFSLDYGLYIKYTMGVGNIIYNKKLRTEKEQKEKFKEICEELEE